MAELSTVARPYAEAVFKLSREANTGDRWSATLALLEVVVRDPDMAALIGNPRVRREQLLGLIADVGGSQLDAEAQRFVAALVENKRLSLLPSIRSQFETLRREHEGVLDAHIESAFALSDAQVATLVADLQKRFKRSIRPAVVVDAALIGGVKVAVGDVVIDGSVRGRLDRMQAALKS
ncbi:MAG: F0F1 ATP synthase subunit delta [Pseudomonadota bacterium]|nr:F0F1 ATP synthase subunit delta [Pseudomonadota bacterium]